MEKDKAMIWTERLGRDFGSTHAVQGLNLSIGPGELFGLVGPDGAGKTTTLRLLAGLLEITAGKGRVAGFDLFSQSEEIKTNIGYMAQQFSLYSELSVRENLLFFADLYDVPRDELEARLDYLLKFAGLDTIQSRRAEHLSGGMQKKLALASTLVHRPKILLLDEPTTGVDPVSRREFWRILLELHLEGTTILVSTPYMDEADRCGRVGLMYAGEMVICDRPDRIRAMVPGEMVEIHADQWQKARSAAQDCPGVLQVQTYGEALHIMVDSADKRMPQLEACLAEQNIQIRRIRPAAPRMEEAFISLIGDLEEKP